MFGRILFIFLFTFSLISCGSKPAEWYTNYDIPNRASLTKEESIPKLINALNDQQPEVRASASEVLGTFGPVAKDAIQKLYTLRTDDQSGTVRLFAHYALKEIAVGNYDGYYLKQPN